MAFWSSCSIKTLIEFMHTNQTNYLQKSSTVSKDATCIWESSQAIFLSARKYHNVQLLLRGCFVMGDGGILLSFCKIKEIWIGKDQLAAQYLTIRRNWSELSSFHHQSWLKIFLQYHILKSLRQKKSLPFKEINYKRIQIQKGTPSNIMCYESS